MKIKIKYLLGLFFIGLGLLINQSFGFNFDLSSIESSSNYRVNSYSYSFGRDCSWSNGNPTGCSGSVGFYRFGIFNGSTSTIFTSSTGVGQLFNKYSSDLTTFNPYNSVYYNGTNFPVYQSYAINSSCDKVSTNFTFLIGNGNNFGSFYFSDSIPDSLIPTSCNFTPIFNFGGLFNSNSNYTIISNPKYGYNSYPYLRFFYTGSLDGFNIINPSSGNSSKFWSWESLTSNGVNTNYGSIVEKYNIYKYTHFGLYSMGYSFIYKNSSSNLDNISWNDLGFSTITDLVEIPLKLLPNDSSSLSSSNLDGFIFDGVLIIPENTYHSSENLGQYVLAKDPNNPSFVMYELYSCQNSYLPAVFSQSGGCYKLDGGYLTYSGSKNILPFTDFNSSINISSNLNNYPFLYLLSGSNHLLSSFVSSNSIDYPITFNNNRSISFGLLSDSGVDLKSIYGNGDNPTYSGSGSLFEDCINTEVCWFSSGSNGEDIKYCTTRCLSSGVIASGSFIGSDGTIYYVDSSYNLGNISNSDGVVYDTGFLDEDGMLSIDYYSGLFNGESHFRLGVCPYPETELFHFVSKVKLGNFYPFMPLNCVGSAFLQGFRVHYFDDFGLFPDMTSYLIKGDTHFHKTLYRFFDVCFSLGLLLWFLALLRVIKK